MDSFPQQKYSKQECILVGRVPPAFVAATRCQYPVRGRVYCTPKTISPQTIPPLGPYAPKEHGTRQEVISYPQKEHGTRQEVISYPPPHRMTDTCKNITFPQLRLRAVKIPSNCNPRSSIFEHRGFNQSASFPE